MTLCILSRSGIWKSQKHNFLLCSFLKHLNDFLKTEPAKVYWCDCLSLPSQNTRSKVLSLNYKGYHSLINSAALVYPVYAWVFCWNRRGCAWFCKRKMWEICMHFVYKNRSQHKRTPLQFLNKKHFGRWVTTRSKKIWLPGDVCLKFRHRKVRKNLTDGIRLLKPFPCLKCYRAHL